MKTTRLLWAMILASASFAVSCSDDEKLVAVTGVELSATSLSLVVGTDSTLVATVTPPDAAVATVTWTSSDETIATVADGKVSALAVGGPVTITATALDGGKSATCAVTVIPPPQLVVSTLAGDGTSGHVDGTGAAAKFDAPQGVAVDAAGNVYVGENAYIRKITPAGVVTTLAGGSAPGFTDGTGAAARFKDVAALVVDATGNIYAADYGNYAIRKITPAGVVTTLAGNGTAGYVDGTGTDAQLGAIGGVALNPSGTTLYMADMTSQCIRQMVIATGVVTTLAGNGMPGHLDGTGTDAEFIFPRGLTIDAAGNLYVTEYLMVHYIRKITPAGVVTTVAGTGEDGYLDGPALSAQFSYPADLTVDAEGNLYVLDSGNRLVRKITPEGEVTTLAGSTQGYLDAPALKAQFDAPMGIAITSDGIIYVSDNRLPRVRKIALE
jgi:sugar lactone lactonase YvrE